MASPRRPITGQRETRALLVEHASRLVEEVGLARFTAREVARRVGVSPAAPFRHFPSRSALLADVAASGFRALQDRMVAATGGPATQGEQVIRRGLEYVAFAEKQPAIFELMFRDDLVVGAEDLVLDHRAAAFNLLIGGATRKGAGGATDLQIGLLAGVHGLAILASRGLLGPLTPEDLRLTLERWVLPGRRSSPDRRGHHDINTHQE